MLLKQIKKSFDFDFTITVTDAQIMTNKQTDTQQRMISLVIDDFQLASHTNSVDPTMITLQCDLSPISEDGVDDAGWGKLQFIDKWLRQHQLTIESGIDPGIDFNTCCFFRCIESYWQQCTPKRI